MTDVYDDIAARYAGQGAAPAPAPSSDAYDAIASRYKSRADQVPNEYARPGSQRYNATWDMSPAEVSMAVFSRSVRNMGEGAKQRMLEYLASDGFSNPQMNTEP